MTIAVVTSFVIFAASALAAEEPRVVDQLSEAMVRQAILANGDTVATGVYPALGINAKNGIDYVVKVAGCTSPDRCQGLIMMACFKRDPTVTLAMVNAFNRAAYFGRAVMKESELCFFAYAITNGGVTQEYLNQTILVFNANSARFVRTIEDGRPKP